MEYIGKIMEIQGFTNVAVFLIGFFVAHAVNKKNREVYKDTIAHQDELIKLKDEEIKKCVNTKENNVNYNTYINFNLNSCFN